MEERFKEILAQYTSLTVEEITEETRFRDDMELSSLDFMTLLGEVEDEFDIEFEETDSVGLFTFGDAVKLIRRKMGDE